MRAACIIRRAIRQDRPTSNVPSRPNPLHLSSEVQRQASVMTEAYHQTLQGHRMAQRTLLLIRCLSVPVLAVAGVMVPEVSKVVVDAQRTTIAFPKLLNMLLLKQMPLLIQERQLTQSTGANPFLAEHT
jgi:hypothetical protein